MNRPSMLVIAPVTALAFGALVTAASCVSGVGAAPTLPVLASGTVADATSGQVLAFASPSPATLSADTDDQPLPTALISTAEIGGDGTFTLYADPSSLPASDRLADGSVNIEAVALVGGLQQEFFFPVVPLASATATSKSSFVSGRSASQRHTPRIRFSMHGPTVTHASAQLRAAAARAAALSSGADDRAVAKSVPGCEILPGDKDLANPEHFVTVNTDGTATARVNEEGSATHSLGIEVMGANGWVAGNGTTDITRTSTTDATSKDRSKTWAYYNLVNYQAMTNTCTGARKAAIGFYDLLVGDLSGAVPEQMLLQSCANHLKGDQWDTSTATAATIGSGVTLGAVSVSAQTGYGSSENIHYEFQTRGEIVGNSTDGPAKSSRVEVDNMRCPLKGAQ